MVTQTSIDAYNWVKPYTGRLHQVILATLSINPPMTREQLEKETGLKTQTLTARVTELKKAGAIQVRGYGKTESGRRAELLTL